MNKPGSHPLMTRAQLNAMLDNSTRAVERAILRLYSFQTAGEKAYGCTDRDNGIGFSKSWAEFGSSIARQIQAGRTLSWKQVRAARKCAKYHGSQLVEFATGSGRFAARTEALL
jgi:hypothetical protein